MELWDFVDIVDVGSRKGFLVWDLASWRRLVRMSDACWDARGSRSFWDLELVLVDGLAASFLLSFSLPVKDVLLLKLNAVEFGFPLAPGPLEKY